MFYFNMFTTTFRRSDPNDETFWPANNLSAHTPAHTSTR
ncbi:unnamed protein product [Ectocarpus sp. CCAP 1310/34]|nr:unnamed protein product [Ectocarpus sp. CCAP 1310/34]